jgi:hypothetical protein
MHLRVFSSAKVVFFSELVLSFFQNYQKYNSFGKNSEYGGAEVLCVEH